MGIVEGGDDLGIHNYEIINDQIRNQRSHQISLIPDGEPSLLLHLMAAETQLNNQGVLMDLFIQPGSECIENIHGRTDDPLAEFFVNQWFSRRIHGSH